MCVCVFVLCVARITILHVRWAPQIIRFIKHDLRINAGAKHVLAAFSADAYVAYQSSRDLSAVVRRYAPDIAANRLHVVEGRKPKVSAFRRAI